MKKNIVADDEDQGPPLTKKELAYLKKQIAEIKDPTRYIVGHPFFSGKRGLRGFYYIIESNMFGMEPTQASPIKALAIARAIQSSLNDKGARKHLNPFMVYKCRITKDKKLKEFKVLKGLG